MEDHTTLFDDIRQGLHRFEARVDGRFASIDARFTQIEARFTQVDNRLHALDHSIDDRLHALDQKIDDGLAGLGQRIDGGLGALDQKMTTYFRWTIGVMIACVTAIFAGMSAIVAVAIAP